MNLLAQAMLVPFLAMTIAATAGPVQFSRDVLPILSENCFSCHGPDESHRKGKLRLDLREDALNSRGNSAAIVPGNPDRSALIVRVNTRHADELMPPPETKRSLTSAQKEILKRWIAEGASWGKHWAFEVPQRPPLPGSQVTGRAANPIDAFVRARLAGTGLKLKGGAELHTLIRRVSFDLTGLPPRPEEIRAFELDRKSGAWERVVDRLLSSKHFGERMAMWWLDVARYSDTDGYQADETRTNWPWRDWVIEAFNKNMPMDQFTREQFAGDLIADATEEQKLATCFHRNHMTNGEGGRDPEESRVDYVIDRVNTIGTAWLGLTLGCCQCHSHKFDPVSQADYYRLTAFFDSIDEDGKAGKGARPYLSYTSPLAGRAVEEAAALVAEREAFEKQARLAAEGPFAKWLEQQVTRTRGDFSAWSPLLGSLESVEGTQFVQTPDGIVQTTGPNPNQDDYRLIAPVGLSRVTGIRLEVFPHETHVGGKFSRGKSGEFLITDIKVQVVRKASSQVRDVVVAGAVADFNADKSKNDNYGDIRDTLDDDPRNGWTTVGAKEIRTHTGVYELAEPLVLLPDEKLLFEMRHRSTLGDASTGRFRVSVTDQAGSAVRSVEPTTLERLAALKIDGADHVPEAMRTELREQFLQDFRPYFEVKSALERARKQLAEAQKAAGKLDVMVLSERKEPRSTHVLVRGVWDKKGDRVERDVPKAIAPWSAGVEKSRLSLADWIVSPQNPLTARVMVNHLWQLIFGAGLVRTPEDFGLQGERPTHPELLDWLAVELMESGWNIKHLIRLMVTSATYKQSSSVIPGELVRDPENRLLARGARFRLPSWMLRDSALVYAGLLNEAVGGPPVRPYQPAGLWEENFMGRFKYEPSEGPAQYRRTLYAFWRRSSAPAFLFDSAQRRVCEVRAPRTNTPLQALTLLNDESYLESSRALADRSLRHSNNTAGRIRFLFRSLLGREAGRPELAILHREFNLAASHYRANPDEAVRLVEPRSHSSKTTGQDAAERAGLTVVASLLLNLDETMTHE